MSDWSQESNVNREPFSAGSLSKSVHIIRARRTQFEWNESPQDSLRSSLYLTKKGGQSVEHSVLNRKFVIYRIFIETREPKVNQVFCSSAFRLSFNGGLLANFVSLTKQLGFFEIISCLHLDNDLTEKRCHRPQSMAVILNRIKIVCRFNTGSEHIRINISPPFSVGIQKHHCFVSRGAMLGILRPRILNASSMRFFQGCWNVQGYFVVDVVRLFRSKYPCFLSGERSI